MRTHRLARWLRGGFAAAALLLGFTGGGVVDRAEAFSPFLVQPDPAVAERSPAYRYANMSNEEAYAELDRRAILYNRVAVAPGVRAPVRLTGRLHGVYIHSSLPPEKRVTSPFEILDARLALALDDFAAVLARHDIDEVIHYTMYRPNGPAPSTTSDGANDGGDEHDHGAAAAPSGRGRASNAAAGKPRATAALPALPHAEAGPDAKPIASANKATAAKPSGKAAAPRKPAGEKPAAAKAVPTPAAPTAAPKKPFAKGTVEGKTGVGGPTGRKQKGPPQKKTPALPPASRVSNEPLAPVTPAAPASPKMPKARTGLATKGGKAATRATRTTPVVRTTRTPAYAPPGTRHPAGLAMNLAAVRKKDGTWLSVARHFQGEIGKKTCGEGADVGSTSESRELRSLVCEANDLGVFTYVLTPNFNAAHADHYHMEIKPGVRWFLYH